MKPVTHEAIGKMIAELCKEHGHVGVDPEQDEAGDVIVIRARSQEPVRCLLPATKRKGKK